MDEPQRRDGYGTGQVTVRRRKEAQGGHVVVVTAPVIRDDSGPSVGEVRERGALSGKRGRTEAVKPHLAHGQWRG